MQLLIIDGSVVERSISSWVRLFADLIVSIEQLEALRECVGRWAPLPGADPGFCEVGVGDCGGDSTTPSSNTRSGGCT